MDMTHLPLARYKTDARDFTRATGLEPADVPSVVRVFTYMTAIIQSHQDNTPISAVTSQTSLFKKHFDLVRLYPQPFIPAGTPIPEETYTGIAISLLFKPLGHILAKISLENARVDTPLQRGLRNSFNARNLLLAEHAGATLNIDRINNQTALLFMLFALSDVMIAMDMTAKQPRASVTQLARRARIERLQPVLFSSSAALARCFQQRYYDLLRLETLQSRLPHTGFTAPRH